MPGAHAEANLDLKRAKSSVRIYVRGDCAERDYQAEEELRNYSSKVNEEE